MADPNQKNVPPPDPMENQKNIPPPDLVNNKKNIRSRDLVRNVKNILARDPEKVMWNNTDPVQSLRSFRMSVEEETQKCIDWYWTKKESKRRPAQGVHLFALLLTALAGIASIVMTLLRNAGVAIPGKVDSGHIATLCIGIAAALIALDRAFGFSSGWTRYVLTATSLTKMLQEFRMDWVALISAAADPPTPEQRTGLIQRTKEFVTSVQAALLQETKDWATEFQGNMAQVEKDLKGHLDNLKAQVEKSEKEKKDVSKPGAIELTLTNAEKTDGFKFDVTLEGASGTFKESVSNAKVWTRINVAPGQYKMTLDAIAQGKDTSTSGIVEVKPDEIAKPSLTLPIQ
jgi:SMODS and SLOG-associating 2TM effector domain 2